jgi:hypothetical protein
MSHPASPPDPEPVGRPFPDPEHSIAPRKPRTVGGAVYLALLGATALGLTLVVLDEPRWGLNVIGGATIAGGLARLGLRGPNAGMLGVRRTFIDVTTLLVLGAAIIVMAGVLRTTP